MLRYLQGRNFDIKRSIIIDGEHFPTYGNFSSYCVKGKLVKFSTRVHTLYGWKSIEKKLTEVIDGFKNTHPYRMYGWIRCELGSILQKNFN